MAVDVTPGAADDLERVVAIDRSVTGSTERRRFLEDALRRGECYIARMEGRLVGFAVIDRSFFGQPLMSLLIVEASHRRHGVGRALVRHLETVARADRLFTSTNQSNVGMQRFCDALGFVRSGRIENLDEGDPELIYVKRLPTTRER